MEQACGKTTGGRPKDDDDDERISTKQMETAAILLSAPPAKEAMDFVCVCVCTRIYISLAAGGLEEEEA